MADCVAQFKGYIVLLRCICNCARHARTQSHSFSQQEHCSEGKKNVATGGCFHTEVQCSNAASIASVIDFTGVSYKQYPACTGLCTAGLQFSSGNGALGCFDCASETYIVCQCDSFANGMVYTYDSPIIVAGTAGATFDMLSINAMIFTGCAPVENAANH